MNRKRKAGESYKKAFTTIELTVAIIVFGVLTTLFFFQKSTYDAFKRDDMRKVAINSIFYTLEMVFYQANGYYPERIELENFDTETGEITPATLPTLNPELLFDPSGRPLGTNDSDFRYEPSNCSNGRCFEYRLSSRMEKEGEYVLHGLGENR
ncbi:type II secretion system GspH family protein [Candidatus Saccharibacteria bacterium]|nr:type II secretion system GspH family protein [Candidatus Saccharibacteria bacterium]